MGSPSCARPKSWCRGRPPAPTTAFGYAYRTTALGAQRVHGQGARCRGGAMLWLACSTHSCDDLAAFVECPDFGELSSRYVNLALY